MHRLIQTPREDWPARLDSIGFCFHSIDEHGIALESSPHQFPYWVESAAYVFSEEEVERLSDATRELHARCLDAVQYVIDQNLFSRMAIPSAFEGYVRTSWRRGDPSLYGRFDMTLDASGVPKMYEYNADTPTSLIESSLAQWFWKVDVHPDRDQFNGIHEALVEQWRRLRSTYPSVAVLHFGCVFDSIEDVGNVEYLMDTAIQAGWNVKILDMSRIGVDRVDQFYDEEDRPVELMFKLYPWEWMIRERFGANLLGSPTRWIEPPWKMVLSNKAILPILWELFPNHPNLLPASFSAELFAGQPHVQKPFLSREGANISLILEDGRAVANGGRYGAEGFIYQGFAPLPRFSDRFATIGSWVVGDEPVGICIREELQPITTNTSYFVPHYIE